MSKKYERGTTVEIIRPNSGWVDGFAKLVGFFGSTWIVMLALGALLPFPGAHLGYWSTAFGLYALRCLLPGSGYAFWSRARRRVKS